MSKVTYLLGAGASFGKRHEDGSIERGVPIISEFANELEDILKEINEVKSDWAEFVFPDEKSEFTKEELERVEDAMLRLLEVCKEYPTVDTFARQLFVTHKHVANPAIPTENGYEDLKRILTVFLIIVQMRHSRDSRYDGFLASIIKNNGTFPPMTILTWNYDMQMELAYRGYLHDEYPGLSTLWWKMNVYNKTFESQYDSDASLAVIKLNGTGYFINNNPSSIQLEQVPLADIFFKDINWGLYRFASRMLEFKLYKNTLSYSWEDKEEIESVVDVACSRVVDTEEFIVIGYSFPYVNREIDTRIIKSMHNLQTIYVQDCNFDEIKDRIRTIVGEAITSDDQDVKIVKVDNLSQFYLPAGFE